VYTHRKGGTLGSFAELMAETIWLIGVRLCTAEKTYVASLTATAQPETPHAMFLP